MTSYNFTHKKRLDQNVSHIVLYTMHFSRLSWRKKIIDVLPFKFGVTGNKQVYVRLSVVPQGNAQPSFITINGYSDEIEGGLSKSAGRGGLEVVDFIPNDFSLGQNYPNPFNPTTTIDYDISEPQFVMIAIFDALGRKVVTLVDEYKTPGRYTVQVNAADLSSGLYLYSMTAGKFKATRRMMLIK